jgi:hypothetical protein
VSPDRQAKAISGYVKAAGGEGQAFWFLNTLTLIKVGSDDSQAELSVLGHRVPPGFAPPPHIHLHSEQAFLIQDGEYAGFCGDQGRPGRPAPARWSSCRAGFPTASPSPRLVRAGQSS